MSAEAIPSMVVHWKVTNFSIWTHMNEPVMYSPYFSLKGENESLFQWNLEINSKEDNKFGVFLRRNRAEDPKHVLTAVPLTWKFRLFKNNDCIENKENISYVFDNDKDNYGNLQMIDLVKLNSIQSNSIFDEDSIIILCEIMNNYRQPGILFKRLTSFIHVSENVTFNWLIQDALNLNIDNRKIFKVGSLTVEFSYITLDDDKVIKAVISGTVKKFWWVCCILFSESNKEFLKEKGFIENLPHEIILESPVTYQDILKNSGKYLTSNSLSLSCSFSIREKEIKQSNSSRSDIIYDPARLHKIRNELKGKSKFTFLNDMKQLNLEKTLSDFTLEVQSKSFFVHSSLLIARSEVFSQMLQTNMKEKNERILIIDDIDENTVSGMLDFIYTDNPGSMNVEQALKLYYAGDKYKIDGLVQKSFDFLVENLTTSNVSDVLELADKHSDHELRSIVLDYIWQHEKEILLSQEFEEFSKKNSSLAAQTWLSIAKLKYSSVPDSALKTPDDESKET